MRLRHKFNAVRTECDGFKFPSKAQARYYSQLKLRQKAGEILFFLMEVPFHLPGNIIYRADFLEFHANGEVRIVDVKGVETPVFKQKKKQVEAMYPVKIDVVSE